ncbi:two-component system response regulator BaeR [Thiocystis minor]|uniref:response regulator n=1 Tax=Thiocystis minor TaxID=61597 RepID=UPI0019122BDA|nr:response regulator [Thiocystis minor]MBK5963844.1 two-component system response regulator BaeR [Thiocystis minor]
MTGQQILIVEDEPKLASLLADYLHASAFRTRIIADGLDVIPAVRADPPALILLDLMLPGRDGLDLCRELRTFTQVPIIMMTARIEEVDRLLGLELGADDYVCKPYHPREVVARVRSQLRRVAWLGMTDPEPAVMGLDVDGERYEARIDGESIDLTPVEFRLLKCLHEQPGRVFSRARLMDHAYTDERVVSDRTVDTHIKNLRRKIQRLRPDWDLIRSIYGVGYKLERPP